MSRVLIAYGTSEGQTARIAMCLAEVIRGRGHDAQAVDLRSATPRLDDFDAVIVGASIHMGRHQKSVRSFVNKNRMALERLPSAFFSVSMAIHDDPDDVRGEVKGSVDKFVQETGWRPAKVGLFAGALAYTKYDIITRWIMRRIAHKKGNRDTDTSRDHVYTDWDVVRRFADEFLVGFAERRTETAQDGGAVKPGM